MTGILIGWATFVLAIFNCILAVYAGNFSAFGGWLVAALMILSRIFLLKQKENL
jgi:hypothetical protein